MVSWLAEYSRCSIWISGCMMSFFSPDFLDVAILNHNMLSICKSTGVSYMEKSIFVCLFVLPCWCLPSLVHLVWNSEVQSWMFCILESKARQKGAKQVSPRGNEDFGLLTFCLSATWKLHHSVISLKQFWIFKINLILFNVSKTLVRETENCE